MDYTSLNRNCQFYISETKIYPYAVDKLILCVKLHPRRPWKIPPGSYVGMNNPCVLDRYSPIHLQGLLDPFPVLQPRMIEVAVCPNSVDTSQAASSQSNTCQPPAECPLTTYTVIDRACLACQAEVNGPDGKCSQQPGAQTNYHLNNEAEVVAYSEVPARPETNSEEIDIIPQLIFGQNIIVQSSPENSSEELSTPIRRIRFRCGIPGSQPKPNPEVSPKQTQEVSRKQPRRTAYE